MHEEVRLANAMLHAIDGRERRTFTPPCGDRLAGGKDYVAGVTGLFDGLRVPGDAVVPDMATLDPNAMPVMAPVGMTGAQLIALVEDAARKGTMVSLTFHGVGGDYLTTSAQAHEATARLPGRAPRHLLGRDLRRHRHLHSLTTGTQMKTRELSSPVAIAIVSLIFFAWGGMTSLNDVLIPHLKAVFAMNYAQTMLIQFTFFGAYFLMSLPSGAIVSRIGYKPSIVVGLITAAIGAALFYPAARLPSYGVFLLALFVLASGITLLQVAANPYISLLGTPATSHSRLNLAQALNSLGTTVFPFFIGPLILSAAVLGADQTRRDVARCTGGLSHRRRRSSVQVPYLLLAGGLVAMAILVLRAAHSVAEARHRRRRRAPPQLSPCIATPAPALGRGRDLPLRRRGSRDRQLPDQLHGEPGNRRPERSHGEPLPRLLLGRRDGRPLHRRGADDRASMRASCSRCARVVAAVLLATTMGTTGHVAMCSVLAIGLFNSIMFPTIFTSAIEGLGPLTGKASSLLVMAIVGGAIVPLLQGVLADRIGIQPAFVLPLLCYAYIAWYGLRGSRIGVMEATPAQAPAARDALNQARRCCGTFAFNSVTSAGSMYA